MDEKNEIKNRTSNVIKNIFHELGQMTGFIPGIGYFRAQPLAIYNGEPSSDTLQHITIFFVHPDGTLEKAGVLSPSVLFSETRDSESTPILYFSLRLDFLQEFDGIASMQYGQEEMINIIRHNFEEFNDRSIGVYFEHCNRFMYHKSALLAGSIPGWISHRRGSGKAYRGMKGHFLCMMDNFLHYDNLLKIPQEELVKMKAKVMGTDRGMTLIPREFVEEKVTTLSFIRIWNCDFKNEYIYDMTGKFWLESVPEKSRSYVEKAKKEHPERVITNEEVRKYLRDYKKTL